MSRKNIKKIIEEKLGEFLAENQMELWNVEFVKESRDWFLRIFIDKIDRAQGSVSLEECEKTSRYLSEILDEEDIIEQNYFLEVSSPGIERELITDKHFERFIKSPVEVKLYKAVDGRKKIQGILKGIREQEIELFKMSNDGTRDESTIFTIKRSDIAKVNLMFIM